MLPVIIIACVAIPVLVIAFTASRRTTEAGEHVAGEDDAARARNEQEFAAAEAFQAEWRKDDEEQHKTDSLY
jgi:hypothetical protein